LLAGRFFLGARKIANVEHNTLTDPELHEPKGVAAATKYKAYVADGAGSGAWTKVAQCRDFTLTALDFSTANSGTGVAVTTKEVASFAFDIHVAQPDLFTGATGDYREYVVGWEPLSTFDAHLHFLRVWIKDDVTIVFEVYNDDGSDHLPSTQNWRITTMINTAT
jgi:hypothetical protein